MCQNVKLLRDAFWSDICNTDLGAYNKFLELCVKYGFQHVPVGDCDGTSADAGSECCSGDNVFCVDSSCVKCMDASQVALVHCTSTASVVVDSEDNGHSSVGQRKSCVSRCGLRANCSCDGLRGSVHFGGDEGLLGCGGKPFEHTKADGRKLGSVVNEPVIGAIAGPNVERNRANRAMQKERRNKRKKLGQDWRKRDGGDMIKQDDGPGAFWNSTSNSVRQRLIDSKAEMHIAENERRTQEAKDKIAYMKSPEATMRKAIGMIEFAEKQAKKENDSKVYGWAKTVATSSAESLARSAPDSVPSFDELSAKLAASSQSSFELELKAKQDEIDECNKKLEQESKRVFELERIKEQQVSKVKHDAVVNRMRQLEMEKNKNNSAKATRLDMNLAPSMKSSDQAYAKKSYIKQFGFYPYDLK